MNKLASQLIALGETHPELRPHLKPVVASLVMAARPIPLSRQMLSRTVQEMLHQAGRKLGNIEPSAAIGVHKQLARVKLDLPNVMGEEKVVHVRLSSKRTPRHPDQLFFGAMGVHRQTSDLVVEIMCSHELSASLLLNYSEDRLREVLAHELTHARDNQRENDVSQYNDDAGEFDPKRYYNDPHEVRAFMRQIVEEVDPLFRKLIARMSERKALDLVLMRSSTWREVKPHLNQLNHNLMLKGVVRALQDLPSLRRNTMSSLNQQLIRLGHTHPELRDHLRPVLAKVAGGPNREIQELIADAEDLKKSDPKKAEKNLNKAWDLAEKSRKPALMSLVHNAFGRVMSSVKVASTGPVLEVYDEYGELGLALKVPVDMWADSYPVKNVIQAEKKMISLAQSLKGHVMSKTPAEMRVLNGGVSLMEIERDQPFITCIIQAAGSRGTMIDPSTLDLPSYASKEGVKLIPLGVRL